MTRRETGRVSGAAEEKTQAMNDEELLGRRFEAERQRLREVAYRMLGSSAEAAEAVQEAWLRLSRTDAEAVENLSAWLTTVVARVSLNMLRGRRTRGERQVRRKYRHPPSRGHHVRERTAWAASQRTSAVELLELPPELVALPRGTPTPVTRSWAITAHGPPQIHPGPRLLGFRRGRGARGLWQPAQPGGASLPEEADVRCHHVSHIMW